MSLYEKLREEACNDWLDRLGNIEFIDDQKEPNDMDHRFAHVMLNEKSRQQGMNVLTLML